MLYDHPSDEDGVERAFGEPLPERTIRTRGLYFTIPPQIEQDIKAASEEEDGFLASIHALEHALISLFPLEILCALVATSVGSRLSIIRTLNGARFRPRWSSGWSRTYSKRSGSWRQCLSGVRNAL